MKIYNLQYNKIFQEKEVLDKETEHSFSYLDSKGKKASMRKITEGYHWCKTKEEAVQIGLAKLKAKVASAEIRLNEAKQDVTRFVDQFKELLNT